MAIIPLTPPHLLHLLPADGAEGGECNLDGLPKMWIYVCFLNSVDIMNAYIELVASFCSIFPASSRVMAGPPSTNRTNEEMPAE